MSWLSSLFSGPKVKAPDIVPQQLEVVRQQAASDAQAQARLDQVQALANQQRADDNARFQAQQEQSKAEAQRQYDAMQAQIESQRQQQEQANAQAESERQAVAAQAQARADASRAYATGRQGLISQANTDVSDAYKGFDQGYFNQFAQGFVDAFKPQLDQNYALEQKARTYGFTDRGTLHGSDAATSFGDLLRGKVTKEGDIANAAQTQAGQFQDDIQTQKSNALNLVNSAGGVGAPNLPDGTTDASGALTSVGSQLGALTAAARTKANAVTRPTFGAPLDLSLAGAGQRPGS
jgi:hypothetical protein